MAVFQYYSRYYDLIYRDKDYNGEALYIKSLIQKYAPSATTVFEMGCGTGRHAALLASEGFQVLGIDRSDSMLASAEERRKDLDITVSERLQFNKGDVCSFKAEEKFDVVTALFHVMSYQVSSEDLFAAFENAVAHMEDGGLFIFDCWYGPAVLSNPPEVRVKRVEDDLISVTRIAEPKSYPQENRVDVHYEIFVQDKESLEITNLQEDHSMRYLFAPEIEILLNATGMELVKVEEWLTGNNPSIDTWGVCFIAKRK